jgi:hypothetical protein
MAAIEGWPAKGLVLNTRRTLPPRTSALLNASRLHHRRLCLTMAEPWLTENAPRAASPATARARHLVQNTSRGCMESCHSPQAIYHRTRKGVSTPLKRLACTIWAPMYDNMSRRFDVKCFYMSMAAMTIPFFRSVVWWPSGHHRPTPHCLALKRATGCRRWLGTFKSSPGKESYRFHRRLCDAARIPPHLFKAH